MARVDFSTVLPRYISLYIFSFLNPKDLCAAAQVSWPWKFLTEQVSSSRLPSPCRNGTQEIICVMGQLGGAAHSNSPCAPAPKHWWGKETREALGTPRTSQPGVYCGERQERPCLTRGGRQGPTLTVVL